MFGLRRREELTKIMQVDFFQVKHRRTNQNVCFLIFNDSSRVVEKKSYFQHEVQFQSNFLANLTLRNLEKNGKHCKKNFFLILKAIEVKYNSFTFV